MKVLNFRPMFSIVAMLAAGAILLAASPVFSADSDPSTAPAAASSVASSKGIAGKWKITMDGANGRQTERDLQITQSGDSYTGKLTGFRRIGGDGQGNGGGGGANGGQGGNRRNRDLDLQDISFKDGEITFTTSMTRQNGESVKRAYRGRLSGDALEGTVEGGQNSRKWRAVRVGGDAPASGDRLAGTWDITVTTPDRDYKGVVTLQKSGDTYSGEYQVALDQSNRSKAPVKDFSMDGGNLKFVVDLPIPGENQTTLHLSFAGSVDGDTVKGQESSSFGTMPFTAIRRKEAASGGVVGEWELTVPTQNGSMNPTLIIRKEGSGYAGEAVMRDDRHVPLKDVTVDGNTFKTSADVERNGQTVHLEMSGTVDGDTLKGEWKSPQRTAALTGKRKSSGHSPITPAPGTTSLAGQWDLEIKTDQGAYNPTLTLKQEGSGYSGEMKLGDRALPIKSVTQDGKTLRFTVEYKQPDSDQPVTVENTFKVDGDTLTGESKTPSGTATVTGKRHVASR